MALSSFFSGLNTSGILKLLVAVMDGDLRLCIEVLLSIEPCPVDSWFRLSSFFCHLAASVAGRLCCATCSALDASRWTLGGTSTLVLCCEYLSCCASSRMLSR